jgi:invasion protein IalB
MRRQRSRRYDGQSSLVTALPLLMLLDFGIGTASAQQAAKPEGNPASETPAGQAFALRGQRAAREIKYSDWHKVCFKTPRTNLVCRTSISGTFETGQSAVRIDLIEREGDKAARLQMFLPVGLYLQAGVKITIDQGGAYRFPLRLVSYQHLHCCRSGRSRVDQGNGDWPETSAQGRGLQRLGGDHGIASQPVRRGSARSSDANLRAKYR